MNWLCDNSWYTYYKLYKLNQKLQWYNWNIVESGDKYHIPPPSKIGKQTLMKFIQDNIINYCILTISYSIGAEILLEIEIMDGIIYNDKFCAAFNLFFTLTFQFLKNSSICVLTYVYAIILVWLICIVLLLKQYLKNFW